MKIKSLEELKKVREESFHKVQLRQAGGNLTDHVKVFVGMDTCGLSAGAREVVNEFTKLSKENNLTDIKIIQVGCHGYCDKEPTVEIHIPNGENVLYGNVDKEVVHRIITEHIIGGKKVEDHILGR